MKKKKKYIKSDIDITQDIKHDFAEFTIFQKEDKKLFIEKIYSNFTGYSSATATKRTKTALFFKKIRWEDSYQIWYL